MKNPLTSTLDALRAAFVLAAMLMVAGAATAQDKEWRPVAPEDLQAGTAKVETDADAEAIFWEVRINDSSNDLSLKHYVRVKIYTERGREKYSKFDIPYTKRLKVKDVAARVIMPDGTITELAKTDIFDREIAKADGVKVKAKSFAVPNIGPGVIVEYRYKEVVEDGGASGLRLDFQRDIPVRSLSYYYKPSYKAEPSYQTFNFADTKFVKDKDGFYVASRENIPAFKSEPFMPPERMARPWMRLGAGRFNFWSMLAKTGLAMGLRKESKALKEDADRIVAGATTDEDKLLKLYAFVQTQISNTSYDPRMTDEMRAKMPAPKTLKDVIKAGRAESWTIDMLFASLALSLGFDARVAYLGDRSQMFTSAQDLQSEYLHPGAIAVKQAAGGWAFFNPGTKYMPAGKLIWYEEDTSAELVGDNGSAWVQSGLSDENYSLAKRKGRFKLLEDGTLEGDVTVERTGHPAVEYRLENYDETNDKLVTQLIDDVKRRISVAEISAASIENLEDASKPLVERYHVRVPNYAQKTGKRLLIQPGYFEYGVPAVFSAATRKYDIFFRYPWSEADDIEISYPANFDLESADSPATAADNAKVGVDEVKISVDKPLSTLIYSRKFHFGANGHVLFKVGFYTPLKALFDRFTQTDAHQIVLKQK